jgi:hypothetical protein
VEDETALNLQLWPVLEKYEEVLPSYFWFLNFEPPYLLVSAKHLFFFFFFPDCRNTGEQGFF